MKKKIEQALQEIEKQENIEILYAIESGSRAWDFLLKIATMMFALSTAER
jgi:hypothetical protein